MTVVAKLGSSIVAGDDGALRDDVLDSRLRAGRRAPRGGENVVLVTSGAIARGHAADGAAGAARGDRRAAGRLGGRPGRPLPRLRGAAGGAARCAPRRCCSRPPTCQLRTHYLNARQTLQRLLAWRVVPVVNENDTTATDEITFGDNDFLAAQVAIMLEARLLVLLTDRRAPHGGPAPHRGRRAGRRGRPTSRELDGLRDRRAHLALRLWAACAARSPPPRWRAPSGSPAVICDGTADGTLRRGGGRRGGRHPLRAASASAPRASSSGSATRSRATARCASTTAPRGCCARAAAACCRSGSPRSRASSRRATRSRSTADGRTIGKGIVNYSAGELRRIKGLRTDKVRELLPHASEEAVHRDYFVLT